MESKVAHLLSFFLFVVSANLVYAQSVPEAINYQAVVRDAQTFLPISERSAYVTVEFLDGPDGDVLYQEEFPSVQTGKAGLINLSLGQGNPLTRSFGEIEWGTTEVWMRLSVDTGEGLNILQESPFNTVPYAFYALNAGSEDADADPTNEIQTLSLEGSSLSISGTESSVDLSVVPGVGVDDDSDPNNEIQDLSIQGTTLLLSGDETGIDLSTIEGLGDDDDANPSNELQSLQLSTQDELTISNSPTDNVIDLSPYKDNTDNQSISMDENNVLSISGSNSTVDLDLLLEGFEDTDSNPQNELQDLQLSGNTLTVSGLDNPTEIDLSHYDQSQLNSGRIFIGNSSNEPEEQEISGDLVLDDTGLTKVFSIMGTNVSTAAPTLDQVFRFNGTHWAPGSNDDADASITNELQNVTSTNGSVTITQSGNDFDLSVPVADGSETSITGGQNTTIAGSGTSGDPYSINVPDNLDNSVTNEIQELTRSGTTLNLSGDPTPGVDLSGFLDNTDNQDLSISYSDNELSLTGDGTSVDLSKYDQSELSEAMIFVGDGSDEPQGVNVSGDATVVSNGTFTVQGLQSIPVANTLPTHKQVLIYNGDSARWEPHSISTVSSTTTTSYYSIDPLDFRELPDPGIGVSLAQNNGLKFFGDDAPFAMMRDNDIIEMMAPVHLPHGATITRMRIYCRNESPSPSSVLGFWLYRKDMVNFSLANELVGTGINLPGNNDDTILNRSIASNNVVDNTNYSYRLFVRFNEFNLETDDTPSTTDVLQRVYGVTIEYTTTN
ncbi:MAG: hypothetical protein AAGC47_00570 [Bacteroidota bacterium]